MVIAMEAETSSDPRPVIQASEILAKIERGEDVEYDYPVKIEGDLDLSRLDLRTEHVDRTELEVKRGLSDDIKVVRSQIIITNSEIQGHVNFGNACFKAKIIFRGVEFGRDVNFQGAGFEREIY